MGGSLARNAATPPTLAPPPDTTTMTSPPPLDTTLTPPPPPDTTTTMTPPSPPDTTMTPPPDATIPPPPFDATISPPLAPRKAAVSPPVKSSLLVLEDISGTEAGFRIHHPRNRKKVVVMEIRDESSPHSVRTHRILQQAAAKLGPMEIFCVNKQDANQLEARFYKKTAGVMMILNSRMLRWIHAEIVSREMKAGEIVMLVENMSS